MLGARLRSLKAFRRLKQVAGIALVVGAADLILGNAQDVPASKARPLWLVGFGGQKEPIAMDGQLRVVIIVDNNQAIVWGDLRLFGGDNERVVRKPTVRGENPVVFLIGHRHPSQSSMLVDKATRSGL
jgi:hypothetical protein